MKNNVLYIFIFFKKFVVNGYFLILQNDSNTFYIATLNYIMYIGYLNIQKNVLLNKTVIKYKFCKFKKCNCTFILYF